MVINNLDLLQETLDCMQEALVFHTPDTKIAFANKAAAKLLGLDLQELQTKDAYNTEWEFIDENEEPLKVEDFPVNIILETKKSFQNYLIGKKFQTHITWFNVNGQIIYDGKKIQYILITFSDITTVKQTQEELKLFKYIVEHADTGITVSDINKKDQPLIYANPMFETLTGYSIDEVLGKNCRFLQGKEREQEGRYIIADAIKTQTPCEVELKNYKKNGALFYNLLNLAPLYDDKERLKYYVGIQHDITKLKNLEIQFKRLINTQDNIVIVTNGKELDFVNNKFFEFFGYRDLDSFKLQQQCICDLFLKNDRFFHKEKVQEGETWIDAILTLQHSQRIVSMMNDSFNIHAFSITISHFDKDNYVVTFTNISQTMLEHLNLLDKTIKDKLTGALNREYFEQNYKHLIQEYNNDKNHLAIALIDIDYFKSVNDTYGHDIGDKILVEFVKTIEKYSRKDDILIRWGGEEFILILKVTSKEGLEKALEHIRKVIEMNTFSVVGKKTCSIGGSIYKNNEEIKATIKRADEAVYEAKGAGRNQVVIK